MEEAMDVDTLEADIRRLRSSHTHLKQKLEDLENKEKQQEERALKRQREEVEPEDVMKTKRLKSVVVINDDDKNEPKVLINFNETHFPGSIRCRINPSRRTQTHLT